MVRNRLSSQTETEIVARNSVYEVSFLTLKKDYLDCGLQMKERGVPWMWAFGVMASSSGH